MESLKILITNRDVNRKPKKNLSGNLESNNICRRVSRTRFGRKEKLLNSHVPSVFTALFLCLNYQLFYMEKGNLDNILWILK